MQIKEHICSYTEILPPAKKLPSCACGLGSKGGDNSLTLSTGGDLVEGSGWKLSSGSTRMDTHSRPVNELGLPLVFRKGNVCGNVVNHS
ncbi:hypothetical protein SRHO_G00135230 [Serrasalmus rhombeus]